MRALSTRLMILCFILISAILLSPFALPPFASGASIETNTQINMGTVLDALLWSKPIDMLQAVSPWKNRDLITPDNNVTTPQARVPFYSIVGGSPVADDQVYYVLNPTLSGAFGSVVYDSITYNYWQYNSDSYVGPLDIEELPYSIDLPLGAFWDTTRQLVEVNALTGLWGLDSLYTIDDKYRLYYDVLSAEPVSLTVEIKRNTDNDANAIPDDIGQVITDNAIWTAEAENRSIIGADLDFSDDIQMPNQAAGTVRLSPEPEITLDIPSSTEFYSAGLAVLPERVIGIVQVANSIAATADIQQSGEKSLENAMPGIPLMADAFLSLHYFKGDTILQPVQEITPLATTLTIQGLSLFEVAAPIYERLAIWRYPLNLDAATGQYIAPTDGEYSLAHADNISLTEGSFSATVSQGGIIVPLRTKLWLDSPFPYILAANSEKQQPIMLKGFFPSWMSATPEFGVPSSDAALQYAVTTSDKNLDFRIPANDIDGFNASYAISPIENVQTPNEAYLWMPSNLPANDSTPIRIMYTEPSNNVLTHDVYVTVANTSLVSVAVINNAAATPLPSRVSLTPGQSEVTLPAGAYPLETGRFFTHTAVEASVDVDEGWGLLRWLQDSVEVSTAPTYSFQVQSNDTTITAEVASYTLSLSVSPSAEWGEILATPSGTPGYAPGTEVVLHAASLLPESYVLHSWQVDGEEFDGSTTNFGEERTLSINRDTTVIANFKRRLRVDTISLMGLPLNRSVPVALTGVFPTWMGTSAEKYSKATLSLTAEEAEATYEILIAGVDASFIAPATSSLLPLGTGITSLDEMDMESKNTAYIWSPEILELPADLTEVPVTIRNRTNPLNFFEILLPKEVFFNVLTLSVATLPENTSGVVLTVPEQGMIPGNDSEPLILSPGDYIAGDTIMLSAVPGYALSKYQITTEAGMQEVTTAEYELTITEDTEVLGIFDAEAYELTFVDSENGTISAEPASSPGWPVGWYEVDSEVTLTATGNSGYRYVSWTHDLAMEQNNPTTITMDRTMLVGALYLTPDNAAITVLPTEGGVVILQPEGDSEETNPNLYIYPANTTVQILGKPDPGFRFDTWRIPDALGDRFIDDNPWDLTLSQDYTVEPQFKEVFTLDFSVMPENAGEIIVTPPQPVPGYDWNTVVTLSAVPTEDTGYKFIQWTGVDTGELLPNSTASTVTLVMNSNKELTARFSKFVVASIEPEETWIIGGIVAKITGESITDSTVVRFGNQSASVFDAAPSGRYAFVRVPPLQNPDDRDEIKVSLDVINNGVVTPYAPGFTYLQRTDTNNLYTTAFIVKQAGTETPVFAARIAGKDARITIPPLGESPVYGIVRIALPGQIAASTETIPGSAVSGLYDIGLHLYMPRTGTADVPQFGVMSYEDVTHELLAFSRPYRHTDASPASLSEPALIAMTVQPDARPTYAEIRNGISLWGIASNYDYLYNTEFVTEVLPSYQSSLQNEEVLPVNEPTTPETDIIHAITGARIYGGTEDIPANSFTWRSGAVLPTTEQKAIKITAINTMPVKGTGSGPVAGGTVITLTSPYGGVAWIQAVEFVGTLPTTGGSVAARDIVSVQGKDEFQLEFKTPKSARPGTTSIIIRTKANPEEPIILKDVFEYTRAPIRWWLILLILLGLMLGIIGMATGF